MSVDITRLNYFVAVADELHFKRAADRLMITPPPLSRQIKHLEKELGGPLFERHYHEVRLTHLGQILLEPARDILRQIDELRATADRITAGASPIRIGASAYAPSDLLAGFEKSIASLAIPMSFQLPGSAADVTARLLSGHLDIGLIHLPATDSRLHYRIVAKYQGAVAVRCDDQLAERDRISIADIRDRQVVIDFARPNPVVLAALTRRLNAHGVDQIVRVIGSRGGELEMATQVFNRRLVALVMYAPASSIGRLFSPPEFKLIPIDENTWKPSTVALAWNTARSHGLPEIEAIVNRIVFELNPGASAGDTRQHVCS
jgi:DNA-binding transcriptional LysR family regulator